MKRSLRERPGDELRLATEISNREFWIVRDYSGQSAGKSVRGELTHLCVHSITNVSSHWSSLEKRNGPILEAMPNGRKPASQKRKPDSLRNGLRHIERNLKYRSMSGTMPPVKFPSPSCPIYFLAIGLVRTNPAPTTNRATPPSMNSVSLFAELS